MDTRRRGSSRPRAISRSDRASLGSAAQQRRRGGNGSQETATYHDIVDFLDEVEGSTTVGSAASVGGAGGGAAALSVPRSAAGLGVDQASILSLSPHRPLTESLLLQHHDAHSLVGSDAGTEAESVFTGVKATIDRLQRESDEKDRLNADLRHEVEGLKRREAERVKDVTRQAESFVKLQKADFEHAMKRNLNTIDQLIEEKKGLVRKLDEGVYERERLEQALSRTQEQAEKEQLTQVTKVKQHLERAEKRRREEWKQKEKGQIREQALKSISPDISRLIAKHKAEVARLHEQHAEELQKRDDALAEKGRSLMQSTARSAAEVEGLAQQMRDEFALRQEEQAAKYARQLEDARKAQQFQIDAVQRVLEEEREAGRRRHAALEGDVREATRREEHSRTTLRDAVAEEKHRLKLEFERRAAEAKDGADRERKSELEVHRMRLLREQDAALQEREAEMAARYTRQRDEEVSRIAGRLEEEAAKVAAEELLEKRALRERVSGLTREGNKLASERDTLAEELKQVRLVLGEKEKDHTAEVQRGKKERARAQLERDRHEEEFAARLAHAESLLGVKFASRITQLEQEAAKARAALDTAARQAEEQREHTEVLLDEQREKHGEELASLQARIKDIIERKDVEIAAQRVAIQQLHAKIKQTDRLLDKHKDLICP